ncbi:MAG: hypothetical protein K8S97_03970 [Anaerolineae bacterium]|nr:hypothetical protein [Anaerolineae bacterium]
MKRNRVWVRVLVTVCVFVMIAAVGSAVLEQAVTEVTPVAAAPIVAHVDVLAQADPDAVWTVRDLAFESHYPDGFLFTAHISSSAGDIEGGRIVWTHAPGTQRSRPLEVDADTGVLSAAWTPGLGDGVPPWVGVTYWWEVRDTVGNAFQTAPQYTEYADNSREWVRTESDDIIVFTTGLGAEANQMVMDAMAEQREMYRAAWGDLLSYKPRAILFGDRAAWNEWRVGLGGVGSAGTTRADWGATVQVGSFAAGFRNLTYGVVPHEVAHLYQMEFVGFMPVDWFMEGNASFFELHRGYDYLARTRQMAINGDLAALFASTGPSIRGQHGRDGYDIGYSFFRWLTETYGLEAHRVLMESLRNGVPRIVALEQVTGLTIAEVESRWRVWLGASPVVPTTAAVPTPLMFPSPTPFGQ